MANPYSRCGQCKGNMWPGGQMDHPHGTPENNPLKEKYRTKPVTRSFPAKPRTNSAVGKVRSIVPRKRAYGPF